MLAIAADRLEIASPLLARCLRIGDQVGVPENGGHRCPNLVAHIGEELRLDARGFERSVACLGQFLRALGQLGRLLLRAATGLPHLHTVALDFLLDTPAVGYVSEVAGEHRWAVATDPDDGELDREFAAVRPHRHDFDPPAKETSRTSGKVPGQTVPMTLPRGRGNDRFVERFADNLCAGVPEGLLGGRVELGDPSVAIHREDTVEGGFENRTLSRFALPQRLFGFPALGDIPHYADKRLGFSLGVGYRGRAQFDR